MQDVWYDIQRRRGTALAQSHTRHRRNPKVSTIDRFIQRSNLPRISNGPFQSSSQGRPFPSRPLVPFSRPFVPGPQGQTEGPPRPYVPYGPGTRTEYTAGQIANTGQQMTGNPFRTQQTPAPRDSNSANTIRPPISQVQPRDSHRILIGTTHVPQPRELEPIMASPQAIPQTSFMHRMVMSS